MQHLTLRSDWENVVRPVVDYALARPDVPRGGSRGSAPASAPTSHRAQRARSIRSPLAALTGEKEHVRFIGAEGAGDHCEAGAPTLYRARSFAWLDRILQPLRRQRRRPHARQRLSFGRRR